MEYKELFTKYIENIKKTEELNSLLLDATNKDVWLLNVKRRANGLEEIFENNQVLLNEADRLNSLQITSKEEAEALYDIAFDYYCEFYDTQILAPLFLRLIKYYETIDDVDLNKLLGSYYIYSACINEVDIRNNREKLFVNYYKEVIKYKDSFLSLRKLGKNCIICAYHSLICATVESNAIPLRENIMYLKEFIDFVNTPSIKEDIKKEGLDEKVRIFLEKSLCLFEFIAELDEVDVKILRDFLELMEKDPKLTEGRLEEPKLRLATNDGTISYEIAAKKILEDYMQIIKKYKKANLDEKTETASDWENALWLSYMNVPFVYEDFVSKIEDKTVAKQLFNKMDDMVSSNWKETKIIDFVHLYPQFISMWINCKLRYVDNRNELRKCLLNGILKKQIPTFIHSVMVKNIALAIYDEMPDLFKDIPTKDVREYISDAAIFHDIGKISIANIVNTQDRRLSNAEFIGIKNHPALGIKVIENTELLNSIKDVILYHHKFYDGTKGYPEDNGNLSSPYKLVIDLVTIADCLDAATDFFGRNYKKAKKANDVFKEFEQDMKTRYNPDIVTRILASGKLQKNLEAITGSQREELMYLAYKNGTENM